MTPFYERDGIQLFHADCLDLLPTLAAGAVDAVVTDPPYGIGYSSGYGSSEWGDGAVRSDGDTAVRDAVLLHFGERVPVLCFGSWRAT